MTPETFQTLVTIVAGGLLAVAGGAVAAWAGLRAAKIQAQATAELDSAKRHDDRQLKREELQRETLLQLQDALNDWMRDVVRGLLADASAISRTGELGLHGDELSVSFLATTRRFALLTERVLDDELRAALTGLRATYSSVQMQWARSTVSLAQVRDFEQRMIFEADDVQTNRLGPVLRQYIAGRP